MNPTSPTPPPPPPDSVPDDDRDPNPRVTGEPAEADQAIDIAGTEADEQAVGEALERPRDGDRRDGGAVDEVRR